VSDTHPAIRAWRAAWAAYRDMQVTDTAIREAGDDLAAALEAAEEALRPIRQMLGDGELVVLYEGNGIALIAARAALERR
jgi:hypothetical protein